MRFAIAALLFWFAAASAGAPALAVEPDEMLDDPVLEARARDISAGLRCLVCQNESIDASGADLARDLRLLVRERLVAGDSDDQVRDFMVARYGDFVLLKPPVKPETYLLWFGPGAILVLASLGAGRYLRRRRMTTGAGGNGAPALNPAERARLERLLAGPGAGPGADSGAERGDGPARD